MPRQQLAAGVGDRLGVLGLAAELDDQAVGDAQIVGVAELVLHRLQPV